MKNRRLQIVSDVRYTLSDLVLFTLTLQWYLCTTLALEGRLSTAGERFEYI